MVSFRLEIVVLLDHACPLSRQMEAARQADAFAVAADVSRPDEEEQQQLEQLQLDRARSLGAETLFAAALTGGTNCQEVAMRLRARLSSSRGACLLEPAYVSSCGRTTLGVLAQSHALSDGLLNDLVALGCSVSQVDGYGLTPLHHFCRGLSDSPDSYAVVKVFETLLKVGARCEMQTPTSRS